MQLKKMGKVASEGCFLDNMESIPFFINARMNEQLRQRIEEVLTYQNGSPEQNQAMNGLLTLIPQLPGIYHSADQRINYQEAFNDALEAISLDKVKISDQEKAKISDRHLRKFVQKRNLDINDASLEIIRDFVTWFNKILKFKIIDLYRRFKIQPLSLDVPLPSENGETYIGTVPTEKPTGIDVLIKQETQQIGQRLWQYIEEDPEGELQSCHPREHPNANCQELAKRLQLKDPPDKLSDIAKEFNVNYQALNSHWKRRCLPLLREIAKNFGYQQDQ